METLTKKEKVKQEIGKAAMQCFARYGLEKTTLDDIAGVIGLNKATLYYYYRNKEDIFLEVAVKEGEVYIRELQEKTRQKKGVAKQVLFYLEERINYYRHVLNLNKVNTETLYKILPRFFELYDAVKQEEIRFLALLIKEGVRSGELVSADAQRLSASLINMSDALKHHTEQEALLRQGTQADYSAGIGEMKFLVTHIINGLKH